MSLDAVHIRYNVLTKNITEIGLFWINLCNFDFKFVFDTCRIKLRVKLNITPMSKQHHTIVFVRIIFLHLNLNCYFKTLFQALSYKSYRHSHYNITTVDESPNKSLFSFHCAGTRSYKYWGRHLLTLSLQQNPLFIRRKMLFTIFKDLFLFQRYSSF